MAFAASAADQVTSLRKLEFQVADKATARVLVELHNQQAFEAGLILVGTLGYMAWLNELGPIAVTARTLDIDLARRQRLKLAAPLRFLDTMKDTGLPFVAVPGLPSTAASTSVKLPGADGLRVDVLAPGKVLGRKPPRTGSRLWCWGPCSPTTTATNSGMPSRRRRSRCGPPSSRC